MTGRLHRLGLLCLLLGLLGGPAQAVIIASGDGTGNTSAPPDDPGWGNVGIVNGLSGIYLGNGWVLTANHVGMGPAQFQGVWYPAVPGSRIQFETSPGLLADLIVFKIEGDPPAPSLPITSAPPAVGADLILIGFGRNRGDPLTWSGIDGWSWAPGKTIRWGTNRVAANSVTEFNTRAFYADFTESPPPQVTAHECQVASGDSGGAVFVQTGGAWELAGVNFLRATYNGQPAETALYGNLSYAVQLSSYRDDILAVASQPACDDGLDDDGDGLVDWPDDPGCDGAADLSEDSPLLPCDDGVDDDGDGLVDFRADGAGDPGCQSPVWIREDPQCDDDLDNDGDGGVDWDGGNAGGTPDPQCVGRPWRNREARSVCGLGVELLLLLPLLMALSRRRSR